MSDIYLFDVDGTLTDAKCKIENSFADEFEAWMDNKEVYIVSGGSFERIIDQLGMNNYEQGRRRLRLYGKYILQQN